MTAAPHLHYPRRLPPKPYPPVSSAGHFLIGRVSGLRASKRRSARRVAAALMHGALGRRPPATRDHTSRDVERPTQRFDGVTKWNALVVSLVLAMPLTLMLTLMPVTRRQMW